MEKIADNSTPFQINDSGELWDCIEQNNQRKEKQNKQQKNHMFLTVITSKEKIEILLPTIIEVDMGGMLGWW